MWRGGYSIRRIIKRKTPGNMGVCVCVKVICENIMPSILFYDSNVLKKRESHC